MAGKSENLKKRLRRRLAQVEGEGPDFDALLDLVDGQLDMTTGGFSEFGSHVRFQQGPGYPPSPGDPPQPPGVPEG